MKGSETLMSINLQQKYQTLMEKNIKFWVTLKLYGGKTGFENFESLNGSYNRKCDKD